MYHKKLNDLIAKISEQEAHSDLKKIIKKYAQIENSDRERGMLSNYYFSGKPFYFRGEEEPVTEDELNKLLEYFDHFVKQAEEYSLRGFNLIKEFRELFNKYDTLKELGPEAFSKFMYKNHDDGQRYIELSYDKIVDSIYDELHFARGGWAKEEYGAIKIGVAREEFYSNIQKIKEDLIFLQAYYPRNINELHRFYGIDNEEDFTKALNHYYKIVISKTVYLQINALPTKNLLICNKMPFTFSNADLGSLLQEFEISDAISIKLLPEDMELPGISQSDLEAFFLNFNNEVQLKKDFDSEKSIRRHLGPGGYVSDKDSSSFEHKVAEILRQFTRNNPIKVHSSEDHKGMQDFHRLYPLDALYSQTEKNTLKVLKEEIETIFFENISKYTDRMFKIFSTYKLDDSILKAHFHNRDREALLEKAFPLKTGVFYKSLKKLEPVIINSLSVTEVVQSRTRYQHNLARKPIIDWSNVSGFSFAKGFESYAFDRINTFTPNETEQSKINLVDIMKEFDNLVAQEIRTKGILEVYPGLKGFLPVKVDPKDKRMEFYFDDKPFRRKLRRFITHTIDREYVWGTKGWADKFNQEDYENSKEFKELLITSRISAHGFSGYRDFRNNLNNVPGNIRAALVPVADEDTAYGEKEDQFLQLSQMYQKYSLPKESFIEKSLELGEDNREEVERQVAWKENLDKCLLNLYRKEEMFLLGKTEYPFNNFFEEPNTALFLAKSWDGKRSMSFPHEILTILKSRMTGERGYMHNFLNLEQIYLSHFSKAEDFNSPEKMEKFLKTLLSLANDIRKYSENNDIRVHESISPSFLKLLEPSIKRFTGTRKEKMIKIMVSADLLDDYYYIKEDIVNSKYIDKILYGVYHSAVELYGKINTAKGPEYSGESSKDINDVINNLLKIKESLEKEGYDAEKILPSDQIKILKEFGNVKSLDEFVEQLGVFFNKAGEVRHKIRKLNYLFETFNQISALKKYYGTADEKVKELFDANIEGDNWRFRVLDSYDPYHFQVGLDTDCCQHLGGAGDMAAVDSFINAEAGVLLLEIESVKGDYVLASQSYFHYVPDEKLFILDNIEAGNMGNEKGQKLIEKTTGYTFEELYAIFAQKIIDKGYKNVLVGKAYTEVLKGKNFETNSRTDDPRYFKVEDEYGDAYSDFDEENSIDLGSPKFKINQRTVESSIISDNFKFAVSSVRFLIDKVKLIKSAGQIPAGMHRSILQTGLFGESEYDELSWIEEEIERSKKKKSKAHDLYRWLIRHKFNREARDLKKLISV